jgi:hypothetical protein
MRPPRGSLGTFRALLHLTACLLIIGFLLSIPAVAQGTKPAPIAPTKKTETGLVFKDMRFRMMSIGDKVYTIGPNARFYALEGAPIKPFQLKPGNFVDIEYLTGGSKTEMWPYLPSERVLTVVRVVHKPRQ